MSLRLVVFIFLLVAGICDTNWAQCQMAKLTASDASEGDLFSFWGPAISMSDDVIIVGAPGNNSCGPCGMQLYCCGAAYVYRLEGTSWLEEQKLLGSDQIAGSRFGQSVSIDGDVAVVGARGGRGAAYVYRYDGTSWIEEAKIQSSDGVAGDDFGNDVSISNGVLVVGAYDDDSVATDSGAGYVFRYVGGTWVEEAKLTPSDGTANQEVGGRVTIHNDVVVLTSAGDQTMGSAYVYRYDGASWTEEQKLTASDGVPGISVGAGFGYSVSISHDVIMLGAPLDDEFCGGCPTDDWCCDAGAVYMFRWTGTEWVEEQKLTASDPSVHDVFGASVSVKGDVAVVGAPGVDDACGGCSPEEFFCCDSGGAYVFRYREGSWTQESKLTASDGTEEDDFGDSVFVDSVILVGASGVDDQATDSGAVYVFCVPATDFVRGDVNGDGVINGITDSLFGLSFQFVPGSPRPPCMDSADVDDDGIVSGLVDSLYLLNFQFVPGSPPPEAPYPACAQDPTSDDLICESSPCP